LERDAAMMDKYMIHFGPGLRTCIGKNISFSEIHKLIPQFVRSFNVELADPSAEWKTGNYWFNKQTELRVRLGHVDTGT
jgi:cytochrome P450